MDVELCLFSVYLARQVNISEICEVINSLKFLYGTIMTLWLNGRYVSPALPQRERFRLEHSHLHHSLISTSQSIGLRNQRLRVRVPPALRQRLIPCHHFFVPFGAPGWNCPLSFASTFALRTKAATRDSSHPRDSLRQTRLKPRHDWFLRVPVRQNHLPRTLSPRSSASQSRC